MSAPQRLVGGQRDHGGRGRALQEDLGPAGEHRGHEGVRRPLPRPAVHRPEDPRGNALGRFFLVGWLLFYCLVCCVFSIVF